MKRVQLKKVLCDVAGSFNDRTHYHSKSMTMTELFSLWGFKTGWLSKRPGGYQISADLGEWGIWYVGKDPKRLEKEFNKACRRITLRRLLPFLALPPSRLSI